MLDKSTTENLIQIARDKDTTGASKVSACALIYELSALPANDILAILQQVIDNPKSKSGIIIKAMALMNKINNTAGREPELNSEDIKRVKTNLEHRYLVCPKEQT